MLRVLLIVLAVLATATGMASAEPSSSARKTAHAPATQSAPYMRVFGSALPPFGFVEFCERVPTECSPTGGNEARYETTPARLSELDEVNRAVNRAIAPATDQQLYGVAEYWTLPSTSGDCEDYALLKRHILVERGWPVSALLITVVRDERGDGHAVLTARTAQGDFILDNKVGTVKLWHQTSYRYIMRQSYVDPRLWMSLAPDDGSRGVPVTSLNSQR